jgi:hypothetical protein
VRLFRKVGIGTRMRKLWRLKLGVVISLAVALFAAIWSIDKVSLSPPGLKSRSLEMATATTHVVVDTPDSTMIDLRQDTYDISSLTNRAVVLGNVIASTNVEAKIAQRAHVPLQALRIQAPLTPQQASPPVNSQTQRHVSDIAKSMDQYRIEIDANPTVPVLDIYAQTPTADSAAALANAAVDELRAYLANLAVTQRTPAKDQIRLRQLGRATGTVINHGARTQVALVVFILTFLGSCATVVFIGRVRAGWRMEAMSERAAGA